MKVKQKALYVGANYNLNIIKKLPFISEFVFIDNKPYSDWGQKTHHHEQNNILSDILPCLFRKNKKFTQPTFITNLKRFASCSNIIILREEHNKIIFFYEKNNQLITYLFNTNIPDDLDKISNIIKDYNHLIVMGFIPNKNILNYTKHNIQFWGDINTTYKLNYKFFHVNDLDNIVFYLDNNNTSKIIDFNMVCNSIFYKFKTWELFKNFKLSH